MEKRLFQYDDIEVNVTFSLEDETIWLSLNDMCLLFQRTKQPLSRQIKTVIRENNLSCKNDESNIGIDSFNIETTERKMETHLAKMETLLPKIKHTERKINTTERKINTTGSDGKTYEVTYYSLEIVSLVGQRIKSGITPFFLAWCEEKLKELKEETPIKSNIIRFEDGNISLDVNFSPEEQTVYLNKEQLIILFETTRQNIEYHIKNIFEIGELEEGATCKKILQVQLEGGREVTRFVDYYNLDLIILIGYRVNTQKGILFRKWANSVLKEYLLKGYVIDKSRAVVTDENFLNLVNTVLSIDNRLRKVEEKEKHLLIEEKIILEGQQFDATVVLSNIVSTAKKSLALIDPFIDIRTLDVFRYKQKEVTLIIITSSKSRLTSYEKDLFNEEYGGLSIYINDSYHDRYLLVDDKLLYRIGSSLNFLGKRFSEISMVDEEDTINLIKERIKKEH